MNGSPADFPETCRALASPRIKKGKKSEKSEKIKKSLPKNSFQYALRLLSYRGRSVAELREKLGLKGFTGQEIDEALQKLERLGYINDPALAGALSIQARETRGLGRRGAQGYLLKRGISASLAEDALAGYDEFEGAMRTARKRLRTLEKADPEARRRRLYGALARRGFSFQTIKKVFDFLKIEEENKNR